MSKILGYGLMVLGLAILVLNLVLKTIKVPIVSDLNVLWVIVISGILIVAGIMFLKSSSRGKEVEEVPIFSGSGKKRKVVGFQRVQN